MILHIVPISQKAWKCLRIKINHQKKITENIFIVFIRHENPINAHCKINLSLAHSLWVRVYNSYCIFVPLHCLHLRGCNLECEKELHISFCERFSCQEFRQLDKSGLKLSHGHHYSHKSSQRYFCTFRSCSPSLRFYFYSLKIEKEDKKLPAQMENVIATHPHSHTLAKFL